jgi:hypothetical protein
MPLADGTARLCVSSLMRIALAAVVLALFTATSPPPTLSVSTITPSGGLTRGGELVHIRGSLFQLLSMQVWFGQQQALIVSAPTEPEVIVVAPPHAAGAVDITIIVAGFPALVVPNAYRYQDADATVIRFLVPVALDSNGAFSTRWRSELLVYNGNAEAVPTDGISIPPFTGGQVPLDVSVGNPSIFLTVPRRLADQVSFSARVHDASHDDQGLGAEIPIVPETQFRRSIALPGVIPDPRQRTLLRVYGLDEGIVKVAVRNTFNNALLSTQTLSLGASSARSFAYGELPIVVSSTDPLRIEVTPATAAAPLVWAFVTMTNNTTQQVTTVTPSAVFAPVAPSFPATLNGGRWAGVAACMDVTPAEVTVRQGCALGKFPTPALDADGRFETDGTFTVFIGPSLPDPKLTSAHFSGIVRGDVLTLTITTPKSTSTTQVTSGSTMPCPVPCP